MPFCYNCGNKLLEGQKFCPNCGCKAATNLNPQANEAPAVASPAAPVQQPTVQQPTTQQPVVATPAGNTQATGTTVQAAPNSGLCRVREGKILAGVCTGLQAKFNLNAWIFRLLFLFVGASGIGLIVYIIMAIALKYSDDPVVTQAVPAPTPDGDVWAQTGKSKTVAIVLSIFFGALGVDRFYMRRTRTGLIKLLVPSIGIWFIIDIVYLCTGKLLPLSRPARETIFGDGIYRVREGKMIAGVCSGLADKFNKNIWIFRGAMIAAAFHVAYRVLTVLIQHSFHFGFFWTFVAILCILLLILYLLIAVSQKDKSEVLAAKEGLPTDGNANIAANGNAAAATGASNPLAEMYRVKEGKILAGVCTGLADKYKQNVWIFRILFLVIGTTGLSLIVYIALALLLKYKEDGNNEEGPVDTTEKKSSNILSEMYRLQQGKIFAGVCSGLGHKNKMNPWVFRILFIVLGSTGIGLIAYIALAVMLKYNEEITDESEINSETLGETVNKFFAGLYRIKEGKILAGVCTGLADKYKLNVWIFRAIALFTGIGSIVYIIFAIMLKYKDAPEEHSASDEIWEKSGKNRAIALILSIFLGYLAVDRFYLRHTGKGLLKLVCPLAGILVGVILMIISSNIRNFDAIKVLSIISMVLIAISCVYMVVWYIVDIIRLAIGKILPKQKKEEDDFVAAEPQPAVEIKMSAAKTEPVEKLVPPPVEKKKPKVEKISLDADFAPEETSSNKVPLIAGIAVVIVGGIIALVMTLTSGSNNAESVDEDAAAQALEEEEKALEDARVAYQESLAEEESSEEEPAAEPVEEPAKDECEPVVWAYIFDSDSTNIRNKMKGKVVLKIGGTPVLGLSSPNKGWWKIEDSGTLGNGVLKGSTTGYWVHGSVVRVKLAPTKGNKVSLRSSPADNAEEVFSVSQDKALVPVDEKDCWVNLKTEDGKNSGWVKKDNINRAEMEKIASAIKPVVQEETPTKQEEVAIPQAKTASKASQPEIEESPVRYPKEEAKKSATGIVKIPATKSITVSHKAVTTKYFNDFLKQHKSQLQKIYQNLLDSSEPFETSYKIRIVVNLSDDSITSVLDKSTPSQKAEKKHGLLFKQLAVQIKSSWEIETRGGEGSAYIEFPLKFVTE